MAVSSYTSDVCADSSIDCAAAAGCTNESGEAKCFCNVGYELTEDGLTCRGKLPFIFKLSIVFIRHILNKNEVRLFMSINEL